MRSLRRLHRAVCWRAGKAEWETAGRRYTNVLGCRSREEKLRQDVAAVDTVCGVKTVRAWNPP